jgi:hypothetical protein
MMFVTTLGMNANFQDLEGATGWFYSGERETGQPFFHAMV